MRRPGGGGYEFCEEKALSKMHCQSENVLCFSACCLRAYSTIKEVLQAKGRGWAGMYETRRGVWHVALGLEGGVGGSRTQNFVSQK